MRLLTPCASFWRGDVAARPAIPEIRIRKLRYEEARRKLIAGLNDAFMASKTRVTVIHGIGTGELKAMTRRVVAELGIGRIVEDPIDSNPGVTLVDLSPPDAKTMRSYL